MGLGRSPQGSLTLALSVLRCSDKFTRFCQWKNVELNIHVSRDPCAAGGGTWVPGRRLLPWRADGHHAGQGHPRTPWAVTPAGAGGAPALTLVGVHVPSLGKLRQCAGQPPRDTPCGCSGVTLASFLPAPAHHERLQRSPHHRPWRLRGGLRLPESGHGQNVTGGQGVLPARPWSRGRAGVGGGVAVTIGVRGCSSVAMAAALLETRGRHGDVMVAVGGSWVR